MFIEGFLLCEVENDHLLYLTSRHEPTAVIWWLLFHDLEQPNLCITAFSIYRATEYYYPILLIDWGVKSGPCTYTYLLPTGFTLGLCGMKILISVRFQFGFPRNRGFSSVSVFWSQTLSSIRFRCQHKIKICMWVLKWRCKRQMTQISSSC
jgi:hypothetical protein